MSKITQEKFQATLPRPPKGPSGWASDKSARRAKKAPGYLNCLPPGQDIEAQELADLRSQPFSMGGETDVSQDFQGATRKGFKRLQMRPTDDEYTNEHVAPFYGEAVDTETGDVGFLERNNVLDRL